VRNRELDRLVKRNPDLPERVQAWASENPAGTLEEAVRALHLWPENPADRDARFLVWERLPDGHPAAVSLAGRSL
jgi:hypothetical protein